MGEQLIPMETARRLKTAGLKWTPDLHDFFCLPDRGMDDRIFVLSDVSADVGLFRGRSAVMFNGASEWALDFELASEVVWLPTEAQLRQMIASRLEAEPQPAIRLAAAPDQCQVEITLHGGRLSFTAPQAGEAYAAALLHLIEAHSPPNASA